MSGQFPVELTERYRPLKLLGTGGMGCVFLVEDAILGRAVALKQLNAEYATTGWAERFRREARVTARLQHPGVVPVYDLIRLADGRAFYTMKPLTGRTFAEAGKEFHSQLLARPAESRVFRTLLRAFVDLCRTIGYAHRHGVIHRDLKGANVQVDEFGAVVVLDWGIAKTIGETDAPGAEDTTTDTTETQTGQVRGTPVYMAPEQAAGDLAKLGPRSDIYSLGAVLFELLTNRPPVDRGKHTGETLANVIAGKIARPRAVVAWVPAALEAVCLKALNANPNDRYATAEALAEDVQRYLDDEGVSVRRAPLAERAGRWARRNRVLVRTSLAGGAIALVALAAVATLQYLNGIKIEGEKKNATQARDVARQRGDDALRAAEEARNAETAARKAEAEARRQAELAKESLRRSLKAIDEALVKLGEDRLRTLPGLQPIRKELLERASAGCDALLELAPNDPAVLGEVGKVRFHLAEAASEVENEQYALEVLAQALAFQKRRAAVAPDDPDAQLDQASTHFLLGVWRGRTGDRTASGNELNAALDLHEKLVANPQVLADPKLKARCECELGRTLIQIALWNLENRSDKKVVFNAMLAGIARLEAAWKANQDDTHYVFALGQGLMFAGQFARGFKEYELARKSLATARKVLTEAPPEVRRQPRIRQQLGNAYNFAYLVENDDGKPNIAYPFLEKAVEIRLQLVRENPAVFAYKADLASVLFSLATRQRANGQLDSAAKLYGQSFVLYEDVTAVNPNVPAYNKTRNAAGYGHADLLLATKRWAESQQAFDRLRPYLVSANDFALVGTGLAKCASGIRGTNATLAGPAERDWRLSASAAVECLREAKTRGDKRTGAQLKELAPLAALRGATGYAEMLKEWGIEEPKE